MRFLRLARTAWDAEALHLRRQARARGIQAGLAAVACVFALMLLLMLHVAAFAALAQTQGPVLAALGVAAADLFVVLGFALLARARGHDQVAEDARRLRVEALRQLGDGAARAAVLAPLLRGQTVKKGLLGAAVTALVVGLVSRR